MNRRDFMKSALGAAFVVALPIQNVEAISYPHVLEPFIRGDRDSMGLEYEGDLRVFIAAEELAHTRNSYDLFYKVYFTDLSHTREPYVL